jgi:hypothetical protein
LSTAARGFPRLVRVTPLLLILLVAAVLTPWRQLRYLTRIEWVWAALVCCTTLAVFAGRMTDVALAVLAVLLLWGIARALSRHRAGLSVRPLLPVFVVGALPLLAFAMIWLSSVA